MSGRERSDFRARVCSPTPHTRFLSPPRRNFCRRQAGRRADRHAARERASEERPTARPRGRPPRLLPTPRAKRERRPRLPAMLRAPSRVGALRGDPLHPPHGLSNTGEEGRADGTPIAAGATPPGHGRRTASGPTSLTDETARGARAGGRGRGRGRQAATTGDSGGMESGEDADPETRGKPEGSRVVDQMDVQQKFTGKSLKLRAFARLASDDLLAPADDEKPMSTIQKLQAKAVKREAKLCAKPSRARSGGRSTSLQEVNVTESAATQNMDVDSQTCRPTVKKRSHSSGEAVGGSAKAKDRRIDDSQHQCSGEQADSAGSDRRDDRRRAPWPTSNRRARRRESNRQRSASPTSSERAHPSAAAARAMQRNIDAIDREGDRWRAQRAAHAARAEEYQQAGRGRRVVRSDDASDDRSWSRGQTKSRHTTTYSGDGDSEARRRVRHRSATRYEQSRRGGICEISPATAKRRGRPSQRPDRYVLGEPFEYWLDMFELAARASRWDDSDKAAVIRLYLPRTASEAIAMIDVERPGAYREQIKRLMARFSVNSNKLRGRLEFTNRLQRDGESAELYAQELKTLAARVYPHVDPGMLADQVFHQFIDGLREADVHDQVLGSAPKNLRAAVTTASTWEAVVKQRRAQTHRPVRRPEPAIAAVVQPAPEDDMAAEIQRISDQLTAELRVTNRQFCDNVAKAAAAQWEQARPAPGIVPPRPLAKPTSTYDASLQLCSRCGERGHTARHCLSEICPVICYRCHQEGHIARHCRSPRVQPRATTEQGNGRRSGSPSPEGLPGPSPLPPN